MPELKNPRHETFAKLVAKGQMTIDDAYVKAGFRKNRGNAARLNAEESIQQRVAELRKAATEEVVVEIVDVLRGLLRIANVDMARAYDEETNTLLPVHKMPDDIRYALASIEVFEEYQGTGKNRVFVGYTKKPKFWDKNKALENLGRYLKMFTDKQEHGLSESLEALVAGSMGDEPPKKEK